MSLRIGIAVALFLYLVFFVSSFIHFSSSCVEYAPGRSNILQRRAHDALVIMWESEIHWAGWGEKIFHGWAGYKIEKESCPVNCVFTANQSKWHEADAILFEPQPFGRRNAPWPPGKVCGQKWVMFSYETALYFPRQAQEWYRKKMDWVMDYTRTADIRVSLTCSWGRPIEDYLLPPPETKTGFAVFVASNCDRGGADKRTAYVKELMNYIPIDSYGLCLQNVPPDKLSRNTDIQRYEDKMKLFSSYKFVLAFENSNTTDYVTEKLSQAFLGLSLPVFMGTDNIDDWLPAEKSIVRTDKFANPRALADHLLTLNASQELYDSYFEWKKEPLSAKFLRTIENCVFHSECRLCQHILKERTQYQSQLAAYGVQPSNFELNDDFFLLHISFVLSVAAMVLLWKCICFKKRVLR